MACTNRTNDTVYVDSVHGNDSTGVIECADHPFQTIAAAIAAIPASSTDLWTLQLAPGQYNGSVTIARDLAIIGSGTASTIVINQSTTPIIDAAHVIFQDLQLRDPVGSIVNVFSGEVKFDHTQIVTIGNTSIGANAGSTLTFNQGEIVLTPGTYPALFSTSGGQLNIQGVNIDITTVPAQTSTFTLFQAWRGVSFSGGNITTSNNTIKLQGLAGANATFQLVDGLNGTFTLQNDLVQMLNPAPFQLATLNGGSLNLNQATIEGVTVPGNNYQGLINTSNNATVSISNSSVNGHSLNGSTGTTQLASSVVGVSGLGTTNLATMGLATNLTTMGLATMGQAMNTTTLPSIGLTTGTTISPMATGTTLAPTDGENDGRLWLARTDPNANLHLDGGIHTNIRLIKAEWVATCPHEKVFRDRFTVRADDFSILADTENGSIRLTIPDRPERATHWSGKILFIRKVSGHHRLIIEAKSIEHDRKITLRERSFVMLQHLPDNSGSCQDGTWWVMARGGV